MKLRAIRLPFKFGRPAGILNEKDASELGVMEGDRVQVKFGKKRIVLTVQITKELIQQGFIGVTDYVSNELGIHDTAEVEVFPSRKPVSVEFIRKKVEGEKLSMDEIRAIVFDIVNNSLSEIEIASFVISSMLHGMDFDEIEWLTRAMIESGERLYFERGIVVDKHSIGGVPGNKISLIIVPTVAAAGLLIPKTASRAITSASGTADTMEVLANVNLNIDEIKEITEKVGGVIAWGGATNIAPADDRIIRVEYQLGISPKPHLIASLLSKKLGNGSQFVAFDIPVGEHMKIENVGVGRSFANKMVELGRKLGLRVTATLTDGSQPVGNAIGPALEAREILNVLESQGVDNPLVDKALSFAGILFEMTGIANDGYSYAKKIFESGKTLEKFKEIISAQGGDEKIRAEDIAVGDKIYTLKSNTEGVVVSVSNKAILRIARAAGAPKDKGAGVYVHKKRGEVVKAGEPLLTIYAEKEWKLDNAIEVARIEKPIVVSGMIIEVFRRG
ncbi:MAG: AMP phosphorylase [Archaeoglobaceae archaeon]